MMPTAATGLVKTPDIRLRTAWIPLLIGAALLPFAQLQTTVPLAAWMAPVLLLRFARTARTRVCLPVLILATCVAQTVALRGIFEWPEVLIVGLTGAFSVVPYLIDRLVARRLSGVPATLIFPAAAVVTEWLISLTGLGTLGSMANSLVVGAGLRQLVSVTGVWGVTFVVCWVAASANEVWSGRMNRVEARRVLAPAMVLVLVVLAAGQARIAFDRPAPETVRVAGLAADRALTDAMDAPSLADLAAGSPQVRRSARAEFTPAADELLERTARVARDGAKIVSWAEAAVFVLAEDSAVLVDRARDLARAEAIYLQLGTVAVRRTQTHPYAENHAIMIGPDGRVIWDYLKTVHPFGDNQVYEPGPGTVPTVSTPYGVLSTVICYDADFPALVRQAGRAGADILLVPANDWQPIDAMLAQASIYRAVENGVSMVRPTGGGHSVIVNHLGETLAFGDYYAADRVTVLADVPIRGRDTPYPFLGEALVLLSAVVLAMLTLLSLVRRRPASPAEQE
ncbi:MAG: nitrilase-related carbon-nitrogen hydrolase [Nocardioides sp.]|uniref:nitrilase-related carbon-nitrogen hydrolase n=1 Tax=Nocardioides sp. TaxID=35761 RepID=UPI003D6A5624